MRRKLIAGNWKMHKTIPEAVKLAEGVKAGCRNISDVDIVICPPFTALGACASVLADSNLGLGGQDMYYETEGAFTGEVSPLMLKDIGCRYVILGHSDRRAYLKETDQLVNAKLKAALRFNVTAIVCIGETLKERKAGREKEVVRAQFEGSFAGVEADQWGSVVIAYEPVWAIGTGKNATGAEAEEMHAFVRGLIRDRHKDVAEEVRILYGGSVKPDNIREFVTQADVDGALVGGASIKAESFIQIVQNSISKGERNKPEVANR
jgi:triosephosphate isomerase